MSGLKDIKNQIFGRLTVIEYVGTNQNKRSIWLCKCECGKEVRVPGSYLKVGSTKSCGCYKRDTLKERNPKKNEFELDGDVTKLFVPVYGGNALTCFIDTAMLEKVKRYRWIARYLKASGYYYVFAVEKTNGIKRTIFIHRFITDAPKGMVVDHKNHNTLDNTLRNLRVCTQRENMQNRKIAPNNTTGMRNVTWNKQNKKW